MKLSDFSYDLPEGLIASHPLAERSSSRLLTVQKAHFSHRQFAQIVELINPEDCLILNDTKVMAARLYGHKSTGGQVEVLIERCLTATRALAHIKASKAPNEGSLLFLGDKTCVRVCNRHLGLFELELTEGGLDFYQLMSEYGHMPLPPYIKRSDSAEDLQRYQTVYAKELGAVAAPTAGLHFDEALLTRLQEKGIAIGRVTLHVGAGTFQPVRVDDIKTHQMHSEWIDVPSSVCELVRETQANGGRVIAVGTTSLRALESAAASGELTPFVGDTNLFIYPGYKFRVVDSLITNFHLPESTLLMLVSAFSGYETVKQAYQEAIEQRYRFFSYGDAMFMDRQVERNNHEV